MKARISPKSVKPSAVGKEGSAGLPNLPNLPYSEFGSQSNTIPSLPSLPFSEFNQTHPLSWLVEEHVKVKCGKLYPVCIIQDDLLAGVAILAA